MRRTIAAAGDTVLVHGGVYNEHVTFSNPATRNGYITFQNRAGRDAPSSTARASTSREHMWGLFTLQNVSYVIVEGFEVRNYTTDSTRDVPIGIFVVGAGSNDQLVNNFVHDITTTAATNPKKCGSERVRHHGLRHQAPTAIDGLAVSGNEVSHLHTGCSETLSLDGNVTNWAVVNNLVHDNDNIAIGAIGFEKVARTRPTTRRATA